MGYFVQSPKSLIKIIQSLKAFLSEDKIKTNKQTKPQYKNTMAVKSITQPFKGPGLKCLYYPYCVSSFCLNSVCKQQHTIQNGIGGL